jgi:hypothetical protein
MCDFTPPYVAARSIAMSDDLSDPAWTEACRREEVIRDLLRRYPGRMTRRARTNETSEFDR